MHCRWSEASWGQTALRHTCDALHDNIITPLVVEASAGMACSTGPYVASVYVVSVLCLATTVKDLTHALPNHVNSCC